MSNGCIGLPLLLLATTRDDADSDDIGNSDDNSDCDDDDDDDDIKSGSACEANALKSNGERPVRAAPCASIAQQHSADASSAALIALVNKCLLCDRMFALMRTCLLDASICEDDVDVCFRCVCRRFVGACCIVGGLARR